MIVQEGPFGHINFRPEALDSNLNAFFLKRKKKTREERRFAVHLRRRRKKKICRHLQSRCYFEWQDSGVMKAFHIMLRI
ncbi:hypothetical protein AQUCO_01600395v1 [Aquilegia coerulea]|uniref:Uncharacterized protein n=1 Tax=Aquilegia coerulea TaxID=218851 RepID=A0A2G5DRF3_AQUCA|nr:hypothetical protein AQUCO_01600395v1 [Aquilegia coerulea]